MPSEPLSQAQAWAHVSPMPCLKVCTLLLLVQLSPICAAIEANPIRPITFFPVTRVQFVCRVPAVNAWDCLQLNHLRCMSRIQTSTGNTGLSLKWQNPSLLLDMSNSTTVNQPPLSPCLARQSQLGMKVTFQTGYVTDDMTWSDAMRCDMIRHDMIW